MTERNRTTFESLVVDTRPDLLRYCTRMVGSVIDAEDIVQDTLAKAYRSLPYPSGANPRGWLFRIAHNKAIDYLRRSRNEPLEYLDESFRNIAPPADPLEEQELLRFALSVFLQLTPKQRSCVILKDVLGYSLAEISDLLDASLPDIKGALHRGRARLRRIAPEHLPESPPLEEREREQLEWYVDRFNARDFDAVRAVLADEVRLDLVHRLKRRGRSEVSHYFHNYAQKDDWHLSLGFADDRPALLVHDPREPASARPTYCIFLTWEAGKLTNIRDYRYAREALRKESIDDTDDDTLPGKGGPR